MDQARTGAFLKELRKERGLTQEQLAERLNVSARTVSRWETGTNMPDLSVLVEISDLYEVDIREIISGERKSGNMDEEMKDTLKQVAEYGEEEKKKLKKRMAGACTAAVILLLFAMLLECTEGFGFIPEEPCKSMIGFAMGFAFGILGMDVLYLCGALDRVRAWKLQRFGKCGKA